MRNFAAHAADITGKWTAKLSGDTIKFSRTMEGEDYGTQPALFTATRVK
jgi:hypothetical protein